MEEGTARKELRRWWREQIDGADEIDIRDLSTKAVTTFSSDPEFCALFVSEFLYPTIYDMGAQIIASRRSFIRSGNKAETVRRTRERIEEEVAQIRTYAPWMEYEPTTQKSVALLSMKKDQVTACAEHRVSAADNHLAAANFLSLIAERMNDIQTVGETLNDHELDRLERQAKQLVATRRPGIKKDSVRTTTRKAA